MYAPKRGAESPRKQNRKREDKRLTAEALRRSIATREAHIELETLKAKVYQHIILFRSPK